MKNILTILLLSIVVVSGCKKKSSSEEETQLNVDAHFQGTWYTTLQKTEYYNGTTEVNEDNVGTGIKYVITENEIKITYTNGVVERATYSISKLNNKNLVTVVRGNTTETYEIKSIDEKVMVWNMETTNQINGSNRQVSIIEFHCPCR